MTRRVFWRWRLATVVPAAVNVGRGGRSGALFLGRLCIRAGRYDIRWTLRLGRLLLRP
ncbi:MAG: hypothetical protein ACRCYU_12695 [Nocardioides sp.]